MRDQQIASTNALAAIEAIGEHRSIERHPALIAWAAGELDRDLLRACAPQLYLLLDVWPRLVSAAHSISDDPTVRRELVAALYALEGPASSPAEMWLQTSSALGLFSDSVRAASAAQATEACINDLVYLAGSSSAAATATLVVFAHNIRLLCRAGQKGAAALGLADGPGAAFFDVVAYTAEHQERGLRTALSIAAEADGHATAAVEHAAHAAHVAISGMISACLPAQQPA